MKLSMVYQRYFHRSLLGERVHQIKGEHVHQIKGEHVGSPLPNSYFCIWLGVLLTNHLRVGVARGWWKKHQPPAETS